MSVWHFEEVWRYREAIWNGLLVTACLNGLTLSLGTILGLLVSTLRGSSLGLLRFLGRVYVDLFRSLPLLVLLVWLFFALPSLTSPSFRLEPFTAAVVGLTLNLSAFVAEIARAGIQAVPSHHVDAASASGFTPLQIWRYIKGPIAARLMIPPLFGQYISQVKLSVLASIIAVPELLHAVNTITTETFRPLELYTTLAAIFLTILLPATWLQAYLETRLSTRDFVKPDFAAIVQPHSGDGRDKIFFKLTPEIMAGWPVLPDGARLLIDDVRSGYNNSTVLNGISFAADRGTVTALVGSNGSGKTTLLRCLCGTLALRSGTVRIAGNDVLPSPKARFGYMSQEHEPWPHLTVQDNLALPLQVVGRLSRRTAKDVALQWLRVAHLEDRQNDRPSQLSGGERQRLVFARTLCLRPQVLLLDEPSSAMDFTWALNVHRTIADLARAGILILVVSHGVAFLRSTAHTVVFLDRGTVIEVGPAACVLREPQSTTLRAFLEAA